MSASVSQARKFCKSYSITSFVCIYMGLLRRPQGRSQAGQASGSVCILFDPIHVPCSRVERLRRTASRCLFEEQRIFSPIYGLRLDELSYNYTPCTFDACRTYVRHQFAYDLSFMESTWPLHLCLCFHSCDFPKIHSSHFPRMR